MRIGKLFDIPIRVHWSWLIGFGIITMLIASGGLPFINTRLTETQEWIIAGVVTICLFLSVLAHELAHSLTAKRLGYTVVSITLMIFGGVSLIAELRSRASHDFLIAAAGPASSLAIGIVAALLYFIYRDPFATGGTAMLQGILFYIGLQNIALAIFNMLPGLPLDGGRVLQSVVWGLTRNRNFATRVAGRAGQILAIVLIGAGIYMMIRSQDLTNGLWLIVIAMFILPASSAETRHASKNRQRDKHAGIPVRSVMSVVPTALNATTPLEAAVRNVLSLRPDVSVPVITDGRVTGMISMRDVSTLGLTQNQGAGLTVADVAQHVSTFVIDPDEDLSQARRLLAGRGIDLLLVFENNRLTGTVSRSDVENVDQPPSSDGPPSPDASGYPPSQV